LLDQWQQSVTSTPQEDSDPVTIWSPNPGPQTEAYYSEADELFYGGAAGGGKTDLGLGLAGTAHQNSIIFRRVFPSIRAVIERSREIFNNRNVPHAKDSYNESLHIWRLADGRMLEFGSIQHAKDVTNYQGRPHDLYVFDEGTEFTEYQYRFVTAWNRSTRPGQRCRVLVTGNPPTNAEGQWVIRYWAPWLDSEHPNPAQPGELRWFASIDGKDTEVESGEPFDLDGELIQPRSRTFIPARLADNPALAQTGYSAVLQGLPEPLRSQLLYGDFSIGLDDDPWQVIPTEWVRLAMKRWQETEKPDVPMSVLGADVARGGKDKTVLSPRYANWYAPLQKHEGRNTKDGPAVAALVVRALDSEDTPIHLDVIGVGASPYDILRSQGYRIQPINFAEASGAMDRTRKLKMRNMRSEAYWCLREALDPVHGDDIALPPDNELLADLTTARWTLTTSGVQIESKEDIIERIGRSPDCGDAVALASLPTRTTGGIYV
jgi:hypothetical protein